MQHHCTIKRNRHKSPPCFSHVAAGEAVLLSCPLSLSSLCTHHPVVAAAAIVLFLPSSVFLVASFSPVSSSRLRGMIRIDYDDGTQEVSEIPDSDIVIYPWRPVEQRVRPRSLAQMRADEEKEREREREREKAGKSEAATAPSNATGNSRKVAVKTEARLPWAPPARGKLAQGQRKSANSTKRDQPRAPPRGATGNGRGAPKASPPRGASSFSSSDDSGDSDDEREDSGEDGETGSREARKNGRLQQKNGKVAAGAGAKGRPPPPSASSSSQQRPGPRKRPAQGRQHARGGSAPKRRRGSRDGEGGSCCLRVSWAGSAASRAVVSRACLLSCTILDCFERVLFWRLFRMDAACAWITNGNRF